MSSLWPTMSGLINERNLQNLLQEWDSKYQKTLNYDPTPVLTRIADLIETERNRFMEKDRDPFDKRHPSVIDPDCAFGHIILLKSQTNLLTVLVNDYLRDTYFSIKKMKREVFGLNVAACRLMLLLMPDNLFFGLLNMQGSGHFLLINQLLKWAGTSPEPLCSYATGLLAYALSFKASVNDLQLYLSLAEDTVPILLTRLHNLRKQQIEAILPSEQETISGYIPIHPASNATKQMLTLWYLAEVSECQKLLPNMIKQAAPGLIWGYLDQKQKSRDSRLTFEVLKFLAALLRHKEVAIEVYEAYGLQIFLDIPFPSVAATGMSLCLYCLVDCEDVMKKVQMLRGYMLADLVKYALCLLEGAHISGRDHAIGILERIVVYRPIMEEFEKQGGLLKLLSVTSTLSIVEKYKENAHVTDEERRHLQSTDHGVYVTIRRYLETHLRLCAALTLRQKGLDVPDPLPLKQFEKSSGMLQDSIELLQGELCAPIDDLVELGGVKLLLQALDVFHDRNPRGTDNTVQSAVIALSICSVAPRTIALLTEPVNFPKTGVDLILHCCDNKTLDPLAQVAALNLLANCVCVPMNQANTVARYSIADLQKLWECVCKSDKFEVLIKLLQPEETTAKADLIRSIACRALTGLARSDLVQRYLVQHPLIAQQQLQVLMRKPILHIKYLDHSLFQQTAQRLLSQLAFQRLDTLEGTECTETNDKEVTNINSEQGGSNDNRYRSVYVKDMIINEDDKHSDTIVHTPWRPPRIEDMIINEDDKHSGIIVHTPWRPPRIEDMIINEDDKHSDTIVHTPWRPPRIEDMIINEDDKHSGIIVHTPWRPPRIEDMIINEDDKHSDNDEDDSDSSWGSFSTKDNIPNENNNCSVNDSNIVMHRDTTSTPTSGEHIIYKANVLSSSMPTPITSSNTTTKLEKFDVKSSSIPILNTSSNTTTMLENCDERSSSIPTSIASSNTTTTLEKFDIKSSSMPILKTSSNTITMFENCDESSSSIPTSITSSNITALLENCDERSSSIPTPITSSNTVTTLEKFDIKSSSMSISKTSSNTITMFENCDERSSSIPTSITSSNITALLENCDERSSSMPTPITLSNTTTTLEKFDIKSSSMPILKTSSNTITMLENCDERSSSIPTSITSSNITALLENCDERSSSMPIPIISSNATTTLKKFDITSSSMPILNASSNTTTILENYDERSSSVPTPITSSNTTTTLEKFDVKSSSMPILKTSSNTITMLENCDETSSSIPTSITSSNITALLENCDERSSSMPIPIMSSNATTTLKKFDITPSSMPILNASSNTTTILEKCDERSSSIPTSITSSNITALLENCDERSSSMPTPITLSNTTTTSEKFDIKSSSMPILKTSSNTITMLENCDERSSSIPTSITSSNITALLENCDERSSSMPIPIISSNATTTLKKFDITSSSMPILNASSNTTTILENYDERSSSVPTPITSSNTTTTLEKFDVKSSSMPILKTSSNTITMLENCDETSSSIPTSITSSNITALLENCDERSSSMPIPIMSSNATTTLKKFDITPSSMPILNASSNTTTILEKCDERSSSVPTPITSSNTTTTLEKFHTKINKLENLFNDIKSHKKKIYNLINDTKKRSHQDSLTRDDFTTETGTTVPDLNSNLHLVSIKPQIPQHVLPKSSEYIIQNNFHKMTSDVPIPDHSYATGSKSIGGLISNVCPPVIYTLSDNIDNLNVVAPSEATYTNMNYSVNTSKEFTKPDNRDALIVFKLNPNMKQNRAYSSILDQFEYSLISTADTGVTLKPNEITYENDVETNACTDELNITNLTTSGNIEYENNLNNLAVSTHQAILYDTEIQSQYFIIDTVSDSNTIPTLSEPSTSENQAKITKKRKCNKDDWIDHKNKKLKNFGEAYEGCRSKKSYPAKVMGPVCSCKKKCGEKFDYQQRLSLFNNFYKLQSHELKWKYITERVVSIPVTRIKLERKNNRTQTHQYSFPLEGCDIPVCKKYFLNTLKISDQSVYTALDKKKGQSLIDSRGTHLNRPHKIRDTIKTIVMEHINLFPVIESSYVKNSSQKYLSEHLNISKMYRLYKTWFARLDRAMPPATKRQYETIFNTEYDYTFFKSKKDSICSICSLYEKTIPKTATQEEYYRAHIQRKNELCKIKEKENNSFDSTHTTIADFDLGYVLSVPQSEVDTFHYKRKYPVYSFTVFDSVNKRGHCYVWHLSIAKRGITEIGSCLLQFIQHEAQRGINHISLYSSCCAGLDKKAYILATYVYALKTYALASITHRFLETGHSQGNDMHACIDRAMKNKVLFTPDQVYSTISNSKVPGGKYSFKEMEQTDFYDIKSLISGKNWVNDTKYKTITWSKIVEAKMSCVRPHVLLLKYDFGNEYFELDTEQNIAKSRRGRSKRRVKPAAMDILKQIYKHHLPISKTLYDDLLEMCASEAIPKHYHGFYKSLVSAKKSDKIDRSDEDDSII